MYKIRCFGWCFQVTVLILKYIFQHPSVHMGRKAGMWCYTYSPLLCKSSNFPKKKPASLASFLVIAEQCMHQHHQCTPAWAGSGLYPCWQAELGSRLQLLCAVQVLLVQRATWVRFLAVDFFVNQLEKPPSVSWNLALRLRFSRHGGLDIRRREVLSPSFLLVGLKKFGTSNLQVSVNVAGRPIAFQVT